MYEIYIETLDKDINIIDEVETLEEAIKVARSYQDNPNRVIWIEHEDKKYDMNGVEI